MLFNSLDFALFFPIVFCLYWFFTATNLRLQNFLIVLASYFFYGWWDWRFLSLIFISTTLDYFIGLRLSKEPVKRKRKFLLWVSILVNIGFLGFFKYFNFFLENFQTAFSFFGKEIGIDSLKIILPVGISFYTFQTLSYTIDVYKGKLAPCKDFISFAAFVSFFPQLVAGPIERASNLLPQFYAKRKFEYDFAVDGMRQILIGFFKKVVIADNCAVFVNLAFNDTTNQPGIILLLGAIFFAFQIYGDFSGYSDIAIGTSKLFGFNLKQNFAFPYFSRDIAEFWRRWHISLSTWFRDYLYIPLGGSKGSNITRIRNVFIIFVVSGFWHGANWTFIIWGLINAIYFLPLLLIKKNRNHLDVVAKGKILPSFLDIIKILTTFLLTVVAWVFFRAENIGHAIIYLKGMFSSELFMLPTYNDSKAFYRLIVFILILIATEWFGRENKHALENIDSKMSLTARFLIYSIFIIIILIFAGGQQEFIYFQF